MKQLLCFLVLCASTASATELKVISLVDVDPQQATPANSVSGILPAKDESRGWAFEIKYRTRLEYIGWNDTDRDGLSTSHEVGIWRNTLAGFSPGFGPFWPSLSVDELVTQTTIPAGTQAELNGPWRRVPVGPIWLEPGQYQVVGENHAGSTDDMVFWASRGPIFPEDKAIAKGVILSGFSYGQPNFGPVNEGGWLESNGSPPVALMGPMLWVHEIPEPSSIITAFVGSCGVWWLRSRK